MICIPLVRLFSAFQWQSRASIVGWCKEGHVRVVSPPNTHNHRPSRRTSYIQIISSLAFAGTMSLGAEICGLSDCGRLLEASHVPCPNCLDVPEDDIFCARSNYNYCCTEHLLADRHTHDQECKERILWRTLVRIGAIYNMLFMCHVMNMVFIRYISTRVDNENMRELVADTQAVTIGERWYPDLMPVEGILGAASFEQCRSAIALLSPVLAWLLQGSSTAVRRLFELTKRSDLPVRVREKSFIPINHTRQVYIRDRWGAKKYASRHLVVTITPERASTRRIEALTLDASSMQYGHTVKTHKDPEYAAAYEKRGQTEWLPFGWTYTELLDEVDDDIDKCIALHLAVRKLNDAVWEEVHDLGGRSRLYEMSHTDFLDARHRIGRAVCEVLPQLRLDLESISMDIVSARPDGPGHKAIVTVMEQYM